jgi:hypothetical protein
MRNDAVIRKITGQIRRMNQRLRETEAGPSNTDLALWGALAIAQFDGTVALGEGSASETELMLSDLLADLMHWCDEGATRPREQAGLFEAALERAREYYQEERSTQLG